MQGCYVSRGSGISFNFVRSRLLIEMWQHQSHNDTLVQCDLGPGSAGKKSLREEL